MTGDDTRFLEALADGCTVAEAAAAGGLSERTAFRRLQRTETREALDAIRRRRIELRDEQFVATVALAGEVARLAYERLRQRLTQKKPQLPPGVEAGLIRVALEYGARYRQVFDSEQRLAEVEDILAEQRRTA